MSTPSLATTSTETGLPVAHRLPPRGQRPSNPSAVDIDPRMGLRFALVISLGYASEGMSRKGRSRPRAEGGT